MVVVEVRRVSLFPLFVVCYVGVVLRYFFFCCVCFCCLVCLLKKKCCWLSVVVVVVCLLLFVLLVSFVEVLCLWSLFVARLLSVLLFRVAGCRCYCLYGVVALVVRCLWCVVVFVVAFGVVVLRVLFSLWLRFVFIVVGCRWSLLLFVYCRHCCLLSAYRGLLLLLFVEVLCLSFLWFVVFVVCFGCGWCCRCSVPAFVVCFSLLLLGCVWCCFVVVFLFVIVVRCACC